MAVVLSEPGRGPKKLHKRGGTGGKILAAILISTVLASGAFLAMGLSGYKDMRDMVLTWTEIANIASTEDPDAPEEYVEMDLTPGSDGSVKIVSAQAPVSSGPDWLYKPINLKALREINDDVSGYIYIPDSNVNYPILKEWEPEEYFYIDHNMYKTRDPYGSIFELSDEERGEPGLDNPITWVFGHHMSSGSMFATLYNYEKADFRDTPVYIYRDDWRAEYEAFGMCYVDMNDSAYAFSDYGRDTPEYEWLLGYLKENDAMKKEGVEWPTKSDDIMILSTCYGRSGTSRRMILLCREARRAMVPEYYDSLEDVKKYGGDDTPVNPSEMPGYVQPDDGITGMDELLGND